MRIKAPSFNLFRPASKISSRTKSKNKSKNTKAELVLRSHVWRLGLRYRLHVPNLPGKPDLVFVSAKVVVFCDGDFWHGRNWRRLKSELRTRSNPDYWIPKIEANIRRDLLQTKWLSKIGWHVIRLWETDILKNPVAVAEEVRRVVKDRHPSS